MKNENTRALYAYWNELRAGRSAPFRREVDPRAIEPLLDSTFILEHIDERSSRFRLAGTKLCENFGMELRGMSALALWQGDDRNQVRDVLNSVVGDPCIGHVSCTVETRGGHLYDAEFLYLPLRSDHGDVSRILGCGYYMGGYTGALGAREPLHHWVDDARLYAIEAYAEDAPALVENGGKTLTRERRALRKEKLAEQLGDFGHRRSRLRSIDGGRRGGLPIGADPALTAERSRAHLRLVK